MKSACALTGFIIERLAYRPLRQAPRLNVLITAIGVSLLLENVGQLIFDKNVVQVMNRAETKSYYMGITRPVSRPRRNSTELLVTVGEAPAGQVRPIQSWFPLGQMEGHAFIYER